MIFWIFLLFLFGIFFPGSSMNGVLEFSVYVLPFWLKIIPGRGFIIFWIFFRNILARDKYERNSGVKFCFHFFGLSHPVWAKNNAGKRFYNFLNFFTIFFSEFSFLGRVWTEFWSEILLFFSKFSCTGRVWTEFWSKILFSLFRPISSCFG